MKKLLETTDFWSRAYEVGINKSLLERNGCLDAFVAGESTPEIDLRLNCDGMIV